ncbi:hypothetical protein LLG95_12155 [bacterium]|nr:hypothetical protein [bacterium]
MAPDKNQEARSAAERHAEMIMNRLNEFLSIRFDHAARINPKLKIIKQDLIYHEMANVRRCLMGDKIYGPSRRKVADVFLGDDDKIRRGLMSPTDQTSIQVELVSHCQDERTESTRGQIKIHDLKTFYASIDNDLSAFLDLVETWIWWDILDAAELIRFEQKLGMLVHIRQGKLTPEGRKRYSGLIQSTAGGEEEAVAQITDEDIIKYEFTQLEKIRDTWATRRGNERGFMYVLKRDELPSESEGALIHRFAEKVREYDSVHDVDDLDEDMRHKYAIEMKILPEKLTREAVLEHLKVSLREQEREMVAQADHDARLGPPYDYKSRLLEQMERKLAETRRQVMPAAAATPAPGAPPAPAPDAAHTPAK